VDGQFAVTERINRCAVFVPLFYRCKNAHRKHLKEMKKKTHRQTFLIFHSHTCLPSDATLLFIIWAWLDTNGGQSFASPQLLRDESTTLFCAVFAPPLRPHVVVGQPDAVWVRVGVGVLRDSNADGRDVGSTQLNRGRWG
jgi:hypothetical protein